MSLRSLLVVWLCAVLCTLLPASASAQTYNSEDELKKAAAAFFDQEDFQKAFPLYSQLVANYPKDVNYNYRLGVCMLSASNEKDKALEYLQTASKSSTVEKEVWFYLGRAYHLSYRFDEAITAYSKYKQTAGEKKAEKYQVDNQLASCRTGKKLLRAITDITVLDRKELTEEDFFRSYDLTGYSGKLLVKPDDFKTSIDKKKKETSVIFLSGEKTEIYFSSYGNDESNGKDIYLIKKLPNGEWSKPQNVGYPINTEYDEDYPFLHPNGKVLYFCSKGHNSMGGYDIFKSTLNEETNTWTKPVNLDFAINTPDDDILFVTDMEEKTAYFSSSRNSKAGYQTVYHVSLDRRPVDICIIRGTFAKAENDENRGANILVKNMDDGSVVGQFRSNSKTGDYLLNLPNGGKFMVTVDKSGMPTQSQMLIVPPQYQIKTIRQEMGYGDVNGNPQLYINTYFDDDSASLSPDFLRKRANLDISNEPIVNNRVAIDIDTSGKNNPNNIAVNDTVKTDTSNSAVSSITGPTKVSTKELVAEAKKDAEETQREATDLANRAGQALAFVDSQNKLAVEKNAAADVAQAAADKETDPEKKKALQHNADSLRAEADIYENNTIAANSIADAARRDAETKKKEADLVTDYAKGLETYSKNNDQKLLDKLGKQEDELQSYADAKSDVEESITGIAEQASAKKRAAEKAEEDAAQTGQELNDIDTQIREKEAEAAKEKDAQLKQGIMDAVADLKDERKEKEAEKKKADTKASLLRDESDNLDAQLLLVQQMAEKIKTNDVPASAIASIDKTALNNNLKAYEREIQESPEQRGFKPIDTSNPVVRNDQRNNTNTNPVDNNQNSSSQGTDGGTPESAAASKPVSALESRFDANLQSASAQADPIASENARADVYRNWEAAIDSAINAQKSALAKAGDSKVKSAINANIAALQKEKKDKHALLAESEKKAALLAQNNSSDPSNPAVVAASEPVSNIEKRFESNLQDIASAGTPESENAKAAVYRNWESAIDSAIASQKTAQTKTRDKATKDALAANIKALQQEKKEKHDLALAAEKQATALAQNNPDNRNPQNNSTASSDPVSTLEKRFETGLDNVNPGDPVIAEKTKAAVYRNWESAIDSSINAQQTALNNTTDPAAQESIKKNIAALKEEKTEKHDLAVAADQQATALAQNNPDNRNPQNNTTASSDPVNTLEKRFDTRIENASSGDPVAAENAKASIYRNWESAIDSSINAQQTALSNTTDPAAQESIKKNIAALKEEKTEKHDLAVAADQQATALAQNNPDNRNPQNNNTASSDPVNTLEKRFDTRIENASSGDPVAAENAKASIYRNWESAIDSSINAQQIALNNTTDPAAQATIKKNIDALKEEKTEKHDLAVAADQKAATLAQTGVLPADNNARFESEMAKADSIPSASARETYKADVHRRWAEALDQEAAATKTALASADTKTEKDSLKKRLAELQRDASKQRQDAKTAESIAARSANTEPVAVENPTLNAPFENSLKTADAQTNPVARDSARAAVYTDWANALDAESAKTKSDLDKERDKKKRIRLQRQVTIYDSLAEVKRSLAAEATASAQNAAQEASTANNATDNSAVYTEPAAAAQNTRRIRLSREATAYRTTADSLRSLASNPTRSEDREELLQAATAADSKADAAQRDADAAQSDANQSQYASNQNTLKKYIRLSASSTVPSVTQAAVISDEADAYFKRAADKRAEAAASSEAGVREELLRDAARLEATGLDRQQQALQAFRSNYPGDPDALLAAQSSGNPDNNNAVVRNDQNNPDNTNRNNPDNTNTNSQVVRNDQNNSASKDIINPVNNQPFTKQEIDQVRNSDAFRQYNNTLKEADQADAQARTQRNQSNQYRQESDNYISQSQKATDEASAATDPTKRQQLLDDAKRYNNLAQVSRAKSDSVNDLADNSEAMARSRRSEAELFLNEIDQTTYTPAQVKAIADADRQSSASTALVKNNPDNNSNRNNPDNNNTIVRNDQTNPDNNSNRNNPDNNNTIVRNDQTNPDNNSGSNTARTNRSVIVNRLSSNDAYVISSTPEYSSVKPIPLDQPTPQGLVYKVQIGAFRNPIPQDLFKGISPITGERTASGVTRYTAGQFEQFNVADAAKNEIRSLGYPDAFVVAFYNNKRISISEAQALQGGSSSALASNSNLNSGSGSDNRSNPTNNGSSDNSTVTNPSNSGSSNDNNTVRSNGNDVRSNSNTAVAANVNTVAETFFTVQVGVYTRPVSKARLFNLDNLFFENLPNGNIRYSSGKYASAEDAVASKNRIVGIGITDAFVTAYRGGKRISIAEARGTTASSPASSGNNGNSSSNQPAGSNDSGSGNTSSGNETGNSSGNETSNRTAPENTVSNSGNSNTSSNSSSDNGASATATNTPLSKPLTATTDSGLVYKVQLGAFREQIPIDIANKFLKLAGRGVRSFREEENNLTVYVVGGYKLYDDAEVLRDEAVSKGISDAFVVAFLDGKKITIEEAKKISGQ